MTGLELHMWRRERKVTQAYLAQALRVSRQTIANWEGGRHRLPMDIAAQLERLAYTMMPKPIDMPPEWVAGPVREERSDLDLYQGKSRGVWLPGSEHPMILLGSPHPLMRDGRWPWSVLDSPEYKTALAIKRRLGGGRPRNNS